MTVEEMITLYDNFGAPATLAVRDSPLLTDREVMASPQVAASLREWWPRIRKLLEVAAAAKRVRADLIAALPHGDQQHRDWLLREIDDVFRDQNAALAALEASP